MNHLVEMTPPVATIVPAGTTLPRVLHCGCAGGLPVGCVFRLLKVLVPWVIVPASEPEQPATFAGSEIVCWAGVAPIPGARCALPDPLVQVSTVVAARAGTELTTMPPAASAPAATIIPKRRNKTASPLSFDRDLACAGPRREPRRPRCPASHRMLLARERCGRLDDPARASYQQP